MPKHVNHLGLSLPTFKGIDRRGGDFEPTRAEHNGLAVHRLNRSAKTGQKGLLHGGKKKKREGERGGKEREGKEKIIISITFHEHSERI